MLEIISFYLVISIFVSFIIMYIFFPNPEVVLKMPNAKHEFSDLYVDENNVCYRYKREEIPCTNI